MYIIENPEAATAYRAALANGNLQTVSCLIYDRTGEVLQGTYVIADSPSIDVRCVEDEEVFNVAEMYVGELNLRLQDTEQSIRTVQIIGGYIKFYWRIKTDEYTIDDVTYDEVSIPLGVWDISEAKRESKEFISITANDCMAKLSAPIGLDSFVGMVTLTSVMNRIKTVLGYQDISDIFAQTPAEIEALFIENPASPLLPLVNCTHYEPTCWDEIRLIAQMIGGFAFADREGKIRFRTFNDLSSTPVLEIPANKRFRVNLQEGQFAVKAVTYTDDKGNLYTSSTSITDADTTSIVCIDYNKYVQPPTNATESYYISIADNILGQISHIRTVPGSVDFYGDPTLDLGDMVLLTNVGDQGIGGTDAKFLITGIYWQFNGPQTITSAGAPLQGKYVSSSSSSGSHSTPVPGGGSSVATANIDTVELTGYTGALFPTARTIARARFSNVTRINAFLECNLTILGTDSSSVKVSVYVDDELQTIAPQSSTTVGQYTTISFTLNMSLSSGTHTVSISAFGVSELTSVSGCVWGQNINALSLIYSDDYTYSIDGDDAIVTRYTGAATQAEIPEKLGGKNTAVIGRYSFKNKAVTTVYIPEGVTTIE